MKLLAINGSPREKWNTAQLLEKITQGASQNGAEVELIHLAELRYNGCISCFNCKRLKSPSYARCSVKDDLSPVLQKAHEADVLVLGSPIYFAMESAFTRAFMERMFFQYNIYTPSAPPLSPPKKASAFVYTMNVSEEYSKNMGFDVVSGTSKGVMERLFKGPCTVFCSFETLQYDDYSKYESERFDGDERKKRHAEIFPKELQAAFDLGAQLVA